MAYSPKRCRVHIRPRLAAALTIVSLLCAARAGADDERQQAAKARVRECGVEEIVFAVRQAGHDGHWYANFSYWSSSPEHAMYGAGGPLCVLNVAAGKVRTLVDDPKGGVRDPQVHYDGRRIVFSYRKGGQPYYHLYEIQADGSGLRQITDGPYDDIEPAWLPDGGIVFCSSRCNRMVNCWFTRVATIHRCEADGSRLHALSANLEQDNTPWVLPDGRLLYQRWEYIDRSQVQFHHLWTMNPDGTGQMVYFGNMRAGTVMIDAKPIPGTRTVLASFSPGHGRMEHAGIVTIVDPSKGPDDPARARALNNSPAFRDPYPLSTDCFLVTGEKTELLVMDAQGNCLPLFDLPAEDKAGNLWVHEPRPLVSRPREAVLADASRPDQATGRVFVQNAYRGRNMQGVQPGEIKKLLVLEALPKPVNFSGGQEPLTLGGSFTLERILGTVPVEADGSAYFEMPAMRAVFFVALDENDLSVKRMQSFMTVRPGETTGCVGCHEPRVEAPATPQPTLAMRRQPSRIEPIADVPDVFDFPRDIQPILDRHCVACHDYDKTARGGPRAGGIILAGDHGPAYSHSYVTLTVKGLYSDGRNGAGNRAPRTIGSSASKLLRMIDGSHYDARLSDHEAKLLRLWIETGATYPGTYAALGSGMVAPPVHRASWAARCGECHSIKNIPPDHWFNLSRPEKSLALLAPLAPEAGGYGLCRRLKSEKPTTDPVAVFTNTADPDYQAMTAAIVAAKTQLEQIKRFDMPGFRPNEHYVRELRVYGILPQNHDIPEPLDSYSLDRDYWRSLWHEPREGP
jgi:cytochrome c553